MQIDRKKNTARNFEWGLISKIISLLCPFASRTVLIYQLGSNYVGLSSLFTSILQILSLAELGLGSAVAYSMYKPIAEDDSETICALLNVYRKLYKIIGCIIAGIGIALIPLLPVIVNQDCPEDINIYILYFIYLFNTAISYWLFAYKSVLVNAFHRNDITSKVSAISYFFRDALQIVVLLLFKNYYLYVIVIVLTTLLNNFLVNFAVNKMFPQYKPAGKINSTVKTNLKKQTSGLMIAKVSGVLRNSFDSVIISTFLGLTILGKYQNYYYIQQSLAAITTLLISSSIAGLGNRIVKESKESNYSLLKRYAFIYMLITGVACTGLLCCYQDFIYLWVGEDYLLSFALVITICIHFYVAKSNEVVYMFKEAAGLWWHDRYRPLIEGGCNLLLNIFLVMNFGVLGVVWSTILTMFVSENIFMTKIVFKHYFERGCAEYNRLQIKYLIRSLISAILVYLLIGRITYFIGTNLIVNFIIKGIIVVVLSIVLNLLLSVFDPDFKDNMLYIKTVVVSVLRR